MPSLECGQRDTQAGQAITAGELDAFFRMWTARDTQYYKFLAYLIGVLRWQDPQPLEFLRQDCMLKTADIRLVAVAIDSLARIGTSKEDKERLEEIALGHFVKYAPKLMEKEPADQHFVQRKAIEALAILGDWKTIDRLRKDRGLARWQPELEQALYRTSEEIYWRLNQNCHL